MKEIILFTIFLLSSINSFAQNDTNTWLKVAQVLRAKGEVKVQAVIDKDGKVASAKADNQKTVLKIVAEKMVLDLHFDPTTTSRTVDIIVNFSEGNWNTIEEGEKELSYDFRTQFSMPSRIDVFFDTYVPKRLLLLRKNGAIEERYCERHQNLMKVEVLPINYGLKEWNDKSFGENYEKAESKLFPNANVEIGGGCVDNGVKEQETYFCEICRMKRKEWLQKNY